MPNNMSTWVYAMFQLCMFILIVTNFKIKI